MFSKKAAMKLISASLVTGALFSAGTAFGPATVDSASAASKMSVAKTSSVNQLAVEKLKLMYKTSLQGEFPRDVSGLKVGKSTKKDVYSKIGAPPMPAGKNSQFDIYTADMGHPGYAFSYNKDKTIKEIRYFGTNVERQTNLGGITTYLLGKYIGKADRILKVPGTGQKDYIYHRGDYDLHFVVGKDKKTAHVNLKKA